MKIYEDSPRIPMQFKVLKFLSGVFLCDARHILMESLSDEVKDCLELSRGSSLLIVQVIDATPHAKKYSSYQQMTFYALGKDEYEDKLILAGPVKFKNMIQEETVIGPDGELVKSSS